MYKNNEPELARPVSSDLGLQISLGDYLLRRVSQAYESGDAETVRYAGAIYEETKIQIDSEHSRRDRALKSGLFAGAPWSYISRVNSERMRQDRAREHGLPANATWSDIYQATS